jgi:crotonobetainyl-CoA:carnitine CoA-transferase CaiB-like acyl-CoA transferase
VLGPYRVLDLTTARGLLCGQILGDLGADVIAVEPPDGAGARQRGPFAGDAPHPDRSLNWWSQARSKRSVVLDLDAAAGRASLLQLARSAHFLIESDAPGVMARRGLGYADLAAINPALVYVSITPFGQDGPKAGWADTDLTVLAAGGPLVLTGDDDRAPVRLPVPQAYLHAAAEAAVAALIAHHERQRSGRGQHVCVSAQQAVALATQSYILSAALNAPQVLRSAGGLKHGKLHARLLFPAADGHVAITFLFGSAIGPFSRRLMQWIHAEGGCDEATRDKDWIGYTQLVFSGREPVGEFERVKDVIAAFTSRRTKAALLAAALEHGLLIAPVSTIEEVVGSEQLAARDYWQPLAHPELGRTVTYPGAFAKFPGTPIAAGRRPPTVGEHTAEVLAERAQDVPAPLRPASDDPPLAGVKMLDLFWVMAGPAATRVLADYGATIVRVESSRRVDTARTLAPFRDGVHGAERSGCFHNLNAGKRMLTLDIGQPEGRAMLFDLVRWADVVTESFAPAVKARLGIDYATLARVKPDVVMVSSCLMGQTGPLADLAGYGNLASAIAGFSNLGGWPDRPPAGPFSAYTDYVSPRLIATSILAALEYRRRTGRGQHIDCSQAEASLHFLAPALLDYTVNGRVGSRVGNRDPDMAPHAVFPAAGDDRWVAIAARNDADWRALCAAMECHDLAADARFATTAARLAHQDELEAIVGAWTAARDAHAVEALLQACGVPASVVQTSADLVRDPQLLHRGHFVRTAHPELGETVVEGSRFRLSRTPARITGVAPTYGCDNEYVLRTILGYDDERITTLVAAGVLE